jgi:hypothetical protein
MRRWMFLFFVSMFIAAGCQEPVAHDAKKPHPMQKKSESDWGLSSTFQSGQRTMIGTPKKLGVRCESGAFVEHQTLKCAWHIWGDRSRLKNASFVVQGVHEGTNQTEFLFSTTLNDAPNLGADTHTPSNITFSKSGRWRMDVYIDHQLFGSIVVDVKKKTSP